MPFLSRNNKTPLGIYIHIPFCRSKCQYCDFYSVTDKDTRTMDSYLYAVCDHIKEAGQLARDYLVDTVYFGGGTPTFFGADGMAAILSTLRKSFDVAKTAEITFEANPDSVSDRLLRRLRNVVNHTLHRITGIIGSRYRKCISERFLLSCSFCYNIFRCFANIIYLLCCICILYWSIGTLKRYINNFCF